MKKIFPWLIILIFASNTVSGFSLYENDAVPASGATVCAGADLSSPIAAVNCLARTESPLQSQVRSSRPSCDTRGSLCEGICASQGLGRIGSFTRMGHSAVIVPACASSCPAGGSTQGEAVRACPGGSPSLLGYLVVLARANLPWACAYNSFCLSKPGCISKAGFFI